MQVILRKSDIDQLSDKEQIEFYRKHFQYQHCESDNCGREVGQSWILYDNCELFCNSCGDYYLEKEREELEHDIKRLERELRISKERLSEIS